MRRDLIVLFIYTYSERINAISRGHILKMKIRWEHTSKYLQHGSLFFNHVQCFVICNLKKTSLIYWGIHIFFNSSEQYFPSLAVFYSIYSQSFSMLPVLFHVWQTDPWYCDSLLMCLIVAPNVLSLNTIITFKWFIKHTMLWTSRCEPHMGLFISMPRLCELSFCSY